MNYFKSTNVTKTFYNMTIGNVPEAQLLNQLTSIRIPRFENNDDDLCPLEYQLSKTSVFFELYDLLEAPTERITLLDEEVLEIKIPLLEQTRLVNESW